MPLLPVVIAGALLFAAPSPPCARAGDDAEALFQQARHAARAQDPAGALELLEQARTRGLAARGRLVTDPAFQALLGDRRFLQLLPPLLPDDRLFREGACVLHRLVGEAPGDQFGWDGRKLGDVDQDGVVDFATCAPTHGRGAGRVYLYSGKSGELRFRFDGRSGAGLGTGLNPAGDVDGDGVPDILAGAPGSAALPGSAVVISGATGKALLELAADSPGDNFGAKLHGAGDIDGDGHGDVAVGASLDDEAGTDAGKVTMYSGKDGKELFTLLGEAPGDNFGSAVAAAFDPEFPFLVVGAMGAGPRRTGRAYVYEMLADEALLLFTVDGDATSVALGQYFVAVPGDVDADGTPDVYVSDWNNTALGPSTGRVFVHSGTDGHLLLTLTGQQPGEGFGTSVSTAGDVNADGHADFIVGAWQNSEEAPSAGKAYLHSGKDGELLATYTCREGGDTLGFDATDLGDVDGDGAVDFLITSAWSFVDGPRQGRVFVLAGPSVRER